MIGEKLTCNQCIEPELTEMDALIAYMQVLGTMVDFSTYTPVANR